MAIQRNMMDVVNLFMECGADPTIANAHGFNCLHIAVREGLLEITKLLHKLEVVGAKAMYAISYTKNEN